MLSTRVIPPLRLSGRGLEKTTGFREPKYVGDPINAIKIFNDKEVDELVLLDIGATRGRRGPAYSTINDIVNECFMPLAYGGGIASVDEMRRILNSGVEKIIINSAAVANPALIEQGAREFGSQAIVVSIDAKRKLFGGYDVHTFAGTKSTGKDPATWAREAQEQGAGEILLTSIDRDGTQKGYDLELLRLLQGSIKIPVITSGGAGSLDDFAAAIKAGASAVAAGAMFVFHGKHQAVLITYPDRAELETHLR